jgi:carboxyl-terminal processing protease
LVTSDFTVSAGEDFTMAMSQLPNVTHRGSRTRGAFSDMLEKGLPNGWKLTLSNEAYLDASGRNLESIGVTPEDPISIFGGDDLDTSHLRAIARIVDTMMQE